MEKSWLASGTTMTTGYLIYNCTYLRRGPTSSMFVGVYILCVIAAFSFDIVMLSVLSFVCYKSLLILF